MHNINRYLENVAKGDQCFQLLYLSDDGWHASIVDRNDDPLYYAHGTTPEAAIASLNALLG